MGQSLIQSKDSSNFREVADIPADAGESLKAMWGGRREMNVTIAPGFTGNEESLLQRALILVQRVLHIHANTSVD